MKTVKYPYGEIEISDKQFYELERQNAVIRIDDDLWIASNFTHVETTSEKIRV